MAKNALGAAAINSGDPAGALDHFTAIRDAAAGRPPSRALADALFGRAAALNYLGRGPRVPPRPGTRWPLPARSATPSERPRRSWFSAVLLTSRTGQTTQVDGDLTGLLRRTCSWALTHVLTDTGDFAAAEPICAATLAQAQEVGDAWNLTGLLSQMADLDLQAGRIQQATGRLNEALRIALRSGNRDDPLRRARQALEAAPAQAAQDRGAAMSWTAAAEYALGEGATDAQIATRPFISVRTVRSHLDRIRDKTGCRRRADLTRLALTAGLV